MIRYCCNQLSKCYYSLVLYLADLRSALPTLDRIVKGFRKLGAVNKTRDVLYFQVTSVHDLIVTSQALVVQRLYNAIKPINLYPVD